MVQLQLDPSAELKCLLLHILVFRRTPAPESGCIQHDTNIERQNRNKNHVG